jgi:hypothetical protein
MASGHVNRIYRPNTWQHRPSLRREDFSCQPGAVHTWHLADTQVCASNVCFRAESGHCYACIDTNGFMSTRPDLVPL